MKDSIKELEQLLHGVENILRLRYNTYITLGDQQKVIVDFVKKAINEEKLQFNYIDVEFKPTKKEITKLLTSENVSEEKAELQI